MARTESTGLSVGLVFDDSLDSPDGVSQYVKTLGAWLSSQGHQVTYLVGETKAKTWAGGQVFSLAKNLKIKWAGNNLSMPIWAHKSMIDEVIKTADFDVLHVQMPYSPLMAQRVIRRANSKTAVIGTFHVFPGNSSSKLGAKLLKIVYGYSLRRFDNILSVSPAAALFAKRGFGVKSSILPNVLDAGRFRVRAGTRRNGRRIVFLGRLVKRKGCQELLRAFALLQKSVPDAELIVAGDGPLRASLEASVQKQKLNNVTFLGFISEADKPALLSSADIACFPSLFGESFGIVLIEAMAAGSGIVLGGDNLGYRSVLGSEPKLLINPKDSAAFANRLEELLSNKAEIAELHGWQTKEVGNYDIDKIGPQLIEIYQQQIARRLKKGNN